MKRQRGRNRNKNNNRNNNHNNHNRSMDSQGPGVKVRGNASTIYEKYTALARDAKMGGSRVNAENLMQHAEHYLRLMNIQEAAKREAQEAREKAEAERAARRAERGDTESEDSTDEPRNNNRSHNYNRRGKAETPTSGETTDSPAELELVEPETAKTEAEAKAPKESAEDAPNRRRKAPSRKSEESIEAAE